ncbi:hypothetical protein F5Y16DRAFT_400146 [Xylariaceae sp. FL0255]|nr:hypothetical protein F5Y16DRAFT_400146 [Xylariaceae sp. FL0255]
MSTITEKFLEVINWFLSWVGLRQGGPEINQGVFGFIFVVLEFVAAIKFLWYIVEPFYEATRKEFSNDWIDHDVPARRDRYAFHKEVAISWFKAYLTWATFAFLESKLGME